VKILARDREKKLLGSLRGSGKAEFVAVYGRRRVGKTYLVRNFFGTERFFLHVTGTPRQSKQVQLASFLTVLQDSLGASLPDKPVTSWPEALDLLRKRLEQLPRSDRVILFFDELPWLATKKSGFVEALSYTWNRYLEADPRIVLIVCGSAASWVIDNVVNARGGLYNRITRQIRLQPLDLHDTEVYVRGKGARLDRKQIVELYMAIGGIPAYLDNVSPGRSAAQLICDICFDPASPLHGEFDRIFRSMFNNSELHTRVMRELLTRRSGMPHKELFARVGITSGSVQTRVKRELIESGFIAETQVFGARKRGALIRLVDEYTIFYLTWRDELTNSRPATDATNWRVLASSPRWRTWTGYAFEGICHNHVAQIAKALGISGIHYTHHAWRSEANGQQAQVDLLIDRADRCINLCEIKFHDREFVITAEYARRLQDRRDRFLDATGTRKTVFTTMLTCQGVKENSHYRSIVDNQLTADSLFAPL